MNFFYLTARLSKLKHSVAERIELKQLLSEVYVSEQKSKDFFEYCKKYKLAPWIYVQLERLEFFENFPNLVKYLFTDIYTKTRKQNEARNKQAALFLKAFETEGIEVAILKGNLLLHTVYQDIGYKKMNDFDILVHKSDWTKIQDIYFRLGYIPLGFGWGGERQKPADYSHVGMSFISPDFSCIVGTQWGLKSPTTKFSVDIDEAWNTAQPFDFNGVSVKKLSPEYNLLHLILHLGLFKCGTRDLMDIANLLQSLQPIEIQKFLAVIKKANAAEKARFALVMTNETFGNVPPELIEGLKPKTFGYISNRLVSALKTLDATGDIHTSYNDYFQDIEKNVIYFGLFPEFHKKLFFYFKILKQIYLPKKNIALKLSDVLPKSGFFARIRARFVAPYHVFSLLAQEIGWKFTILLYLKLGFDLTFSLKNYIFKQDSYFDYLKKLGIEPDEIQRVVKGIE